MNVIDYNPWDTGTAKPWPQTPPPQPSVPQPPTQVWVTPSVFAPMWELAALKAYEAMEAYYVALKEQLESGERKGDGDG